MRILYLDIDTLRPDHLGCYGYHRNTSPNLDRLAAQSVRFDNCYVSDAPCLPSRASMFTGQLGIHSGIVGHGGTAADRRLDGYGRGFGAKWGGQPGLVMSLRNQGYYPVSFSPFAERHAAWWFYEGWQEMYNSGKCGTERADDIVPAALDWIDKNGQRDNWLLHVNIWDPHTPYQAPEDFGNPFSKQPIEDWYTEAMRKRQWKGFGPGGPQEPAGNWGRESKWPRQPSQVKSMADYRKWVDGYDTGIRYADMWAGRVLEALQAKGVLDDTAVIVTSDHGETLGELNVIGDHQTADNVVSRVPMIVRWPGMKKGRADQSLHYQTDIAATLLELCGGQVPAHWDGRSFAGAFKANKSRGRDYIVVSQCCWSCQRAVRWDDWIFIRTYHTGLKDYPPRMLFNVKNDPHELNNLADKHPKIADRGAALLEEWVSQMMAVSTSSVDPLWTVMREGGPFHARGERTEFYLNRLRQTGRSKAADYLQAHPTGLAT